MPFLHHPDDIWTQLTESGNTELFLNKFMTLMLLKSYIRPDMSNKYLK